MTTKPTLRLNKAAVTDSTRLPVVTVNMREQDRTMVNFKRPNLNSNFTYDYGFEVESTDVIFDQPEAAKDLVMILGLAGEPCFISDCQLGNIQKVEETKGAYPVIRISPEVTFEIKPGKAIRKPLEVYVRQFSTPVIN